MWSNSSRCRQESVYLTRTWCLYYIIIALDIVITLRFSINCSAVICSPIVLFAIMREASSETYGPRIYKLKIPKILCCNLFTFVSAIFYIYLYQISSLQVTVKGLTTPLSLWVQVFDCLCRCIDWRHACISLWIDTLVLNRGNTYLYFAASPFPLQGKNQRKLKK